MSTALTQSSLWALTIVIISLFIYSLSQFIFSINRPNRGWSYPSLHWPYILIIYIWLYINCKLFFDITSECAIYWDVVILIYMFPYHLYPWAIYSIFNLCAYELDIMYPFRRNSYPDVSSLSLSLSFYFIPVIKYEFIIRRCFTFLFVFDRHSQFIRTRKIGT